MHSNSNAVKGSSTLADLAGWLFGLIGLAIGVVNTFWGNDPGFGIFIALLALLYVPPVNGWIRQKTGFAVPLLARIVLGFLIIWAALGVGELFHKIDLMLSSF
ncbi:hypothetical protein LJY25_08665 [Hymenobacter sp. BT175]|uniref:hypothetical protein n=1 Tax=Hymenobacter translucens TaxID=2886507 RepID=UPI001D0F3714|nr:hypothetical protein [Hymenobacter translucens]MCC2546513.1 hypothetical protein [Hymenobacter translucens]